MLYFCQTLNRFITPNKVDFSTFQLFNFSTFQLSPMSLNIKKAVFPVAGMGTRFLPATKACPKEMLPVVDKPLIQYAVEEAIAAGITDLIFVTSWTKRPIEDHFDKNFELEYKLEQAGKQKLLETVKGILPNIGTTLSSTACDQS